MGSIMNENRNPFHETFIGPGSGPGEFLGALHHGGAQPPGGR
jgi:hypothetical protein